MRVREIRTNPVAVVEFTAEEVYALRSIVGNTENADWKKAMKMGGYEGLDENQHIQTMLYDALTRLSAEMEVRFT